MVTFEQFLNDAAVKGEAVNILFEERLFDLVGVLHKIGDKLVEADIPHELIGGLAVLVHVEEADPTHAMLTRDVDLLVRRADLDRIKEAAAQHGFRHAPEADAHLHNGTDRGRNAVHLIFSGEPIAPVKRKILGRDVMVIPLGDLLRMKLSSFRLKDQVHVQVMDAAGLITPAIEKSLAPELARRLQQVRDSE